MLLYTNMSVGYILAVEIGVDWQNILAPEPKYDAIQSTSIIQTMNDFQRASNHQSASTSPSSPSADTSSVMGSSTEDVKDGFELRLRAMRTELITHVVVLGGLIALLWFIEVVDQLIWRETLDLLGIQPRTSDGLTHIFFAPFLHKGFGHLFANTLPFLVLGWLVLLRGVGEFILVGLTAAIVSGAGIWLLGMPGTVHIGMSGVIFGFLGFLLLRGYFERSTSAISLAVLVGLLYGSMIWGVLPLQPNVSWLGHLFGFLGGGLAAYLFAKRREGV